MRHLKISTLPSAKYWHDRDSIMLHACFQILVDFVEKEDGLNQWCAEDYKEQITEMKYLYDWWKDENEECSEQALDEHLIRLIKIRGYLWT
jgi:hypothetical protein